MTSPNDRVTGVGELLVGVAGAACPDLQLVALGCQSVGIIQTFVTEESESTTGGGPSLRLRVGGASLDGNGGTVGVA